MKRWLAYLAAALLAAVDLGLLAYLLRRPLSERWLCGLLARELTAALGAEVEIGGIGGNWIDSVRLDGVQWRGRAGDLVREVRDLRLRAALSPWRLLHGDPRGLLGLRLDARRVVLDAGGRPPGGALAPAAGAARPADLAPLAGFLPRGAVVAVDELDFGAANERRRGRFDLRLEPGRRARRLTATHPGLAADVDVVAHAGGPPGCSGTLRAADPAQLLACLGLPRPAPAVAGGSVWVAADVEFAPWRIAGVVALDGLRSADAELRHGVLAAVADERSLRIHTGRVELPGVELRTAGLVLPSPFAGQPITAAEVAGDVDLRLADLTPYRALLPAVLGDLLPVRGRVQGWLDRGLLHVGQCRLTSPGVAVAVARGRLPLAGPARAAPGDLGLEFTIDVPERRAFTLGGVAFATSGRVTGTLAGSLASLRAHADVALGASAFAGRTAGRIAGAIEFEHGILRATGLELADVAPALGQAAEGARVRGAASLALGEGGQPVRIAGDLAATVTRGWLTAAGLDPQRAARIRPFELALRGTLALAGGRPAAGTATVRLADLVVGDLPPAALDAELAFDGASLHIDHCRLREPAVLELHGIVPLAPDGPLSLHLLAPDQDVAFWSALLAPTPLSGRVSLQADATGTLAAPEVTLAATGAVASLAPFLGNWPDDVFGAPPPGPWTIAVRATHDARGVAVDALRLASAPAAAPQLELRGEGRLPWRLGAGRQVAAGGGAFALALEARGPGGARLGLPWTLSAGLQIDDQRTAVDRCELRAGPGSLTGTCAVAAGLPQLLSDPAAFAGAAVQGRFTLAGLKLEQVPAAWTGPATATGAVAGQITLVGTVTEPRPELELQLAGAQVRMAGAPRLTDLSARIVATPRRFAVHDLRAKLGAGPIRLDATLTSTDPRWADPAAVAVAGTLHGEQALVVNTSQLKVRGNVDLAVRGTLAKMQVRGAVGVTTGRFAQRITAVPGLDTLRARGGVSTGEGIALHLLEPPFGQRIELDIAVKTVRDFEVRTHTLDTDLRADLRLLGDAATARLNGTVSASSGTLRLPGSTLLLHSLSASFTEAKPFHPDLQVVAEGRRHGYRVQVTVRGDTRAPEIELTSTPPLPPEDLLVLVTTGSLPERGKALGSRAQASLIGSYLAQELAAWYLGGETTEASRETFLDRFSVATGTEISDKGIETVVVEFQLTDLLSLQAERDVYEDYNGGLALHWRFR